MALPATLAIIDDDADHAAYLAQFLEQRGVAVTVFHDSDEFLTSPAAFEFDFYVIDLMLPGIDGVDLIRLVRRRGNAGIVVVSGRMDADVFESVMRTGADMHLMKPVRMEQVALAIEAVQRRIEGGRAQAGAWRLDRKARQLIAPEGTRIELSDNNLAVIECFVDANGATVTHAMLCERLGRDAAQEADNLLHAAIYRLRRRIERATPASVPLHVEPRVGYAFRGTLTAI
ncbi:response regulator transcription factor [Aquincola sp. S2]|uniref:Response regulator transcription factor n=1 Tax=Pseudaquabacterium terrae TaxID=2732868 RepID=A0ABX2EGL0_9BURK|nr:response regulator transcription factor [Aquabacterium terrae]NRF67734.1 response regulator transcription factor [Aquabacterium terrae]